MAKPNQRAWRSIGALALQFSKTWQGAGKEKSQSRDFVREFLNVFAAGAVAPDAFVSGEFESEVRTPEGQVNWIDFYWKGKIAIEMKSKGGSLDEAFGQLRGYMDCLPEGEAPPDLWMVSDFENIRVWHIDAGQRVDFKTAKLKKYIRHFAVLANYEQERIRTDKESVNVQAAEKMAALHEALKGHGYSGHDLQVYVARLLFCLFADDTGIFPQDTFWRYIEDSRENGSDLSGRLAQLFQDLSQPVGERTRNPYLSDSISPSDFQHINGGLFEERLGMASFDEKMRRALLDCLEFDWGGISPAIFGSMFQGAMEGGERREIGAHYTSEENILKLIDPLFMDGLREEFERAKGKKSKRTLADFHRKLASLKFLDPACGCGNFLIIAYRELRRLELDVVREERHLAGDSGGQMLDIDAHFLVRVEQFHGIEILPWPCQLAVTGLWLMDHLMNMEASEEFGRYFARLPLTEGARVVEGNALRLDWSSVVTKGELSYIMGNPPFIGYSNQSVAQKADTLSVCVGPDGRPIKGAGKIDYVAAWYYKAAGLIAGTGIRCAFVSTNSITQGEQAAAVWRPLIELFGLHIDFAHRAFKWTNEARGRAAVHCVIVGFGAGQGSEKTIFDGGNRIPAKNINPYLVDAPNVFIEARRAPICNVPELISGNRPTDGGHLIIEDADMEAFVRADPLSKKFIKRFMMGEEFINGRPRWCLWLVGVPPQEMRGMPKVMERVAACKRDREGSPDEGRRKLAKTPAQFRETNNPDRYIAIPKVSSENRHYIPIGFLDGATIPGDKLFAVPGADLYHFGVLTSGVHMAWTRAVCGRLEISYSYSRNIVYNNFPWPEATEAQRAEIENLAQGVLDARAVFPNASLSDLYDPIAMPPELSKAHERLDRAVMRLYGYKKDTTETAIVADLMERYRKLAADAKARP